MVFASKRSVKTGSVLLWRISAKPSSKIILRPSIVMISLIFEPNNSSEAAEKILQLLLSPEMRSTCKSQMAKQLAKYGNYEEHFNEIKKFLILQAINKS